MADEKWSELPSASSLADADQGVGLQSGSNKRWSLSVLKTYVQAAFDAIYVPLSRTLNIGGSSQSLAANRTWTTSDILDSLGSTQGDILIRSNSAWIVLAPGTDGFQLTTHGASANPTWAASAASGAALTRTNDTNVTVTLGGSPTTALVNASSLTLGWTGTLAASRGGTGVGTLGDITKTNDTNVTLTLGGTPTGAVITSTSFTLGWTGTLAVGRGGTGVGSLGNITKTDDTNVTLTLGGTPTGAVINATSFTLGWTGNLSVARGGSGAGTLTGVLIGNGTSAFTTVTAPSGTIVGTTDTQTLTNKRNTPRITTITSSATPTINTDNCDCVTITALAAAITSMSSGLSGTPTNFDKLIFRIKDDGNARAITWGASFVAKGVALPTTTVVSKLLTVGFIYDTVATTWGCVASAQEA